MKLKSLFLVVLAVCTFSACKNGNEPSSTNDSTRTIEINSTCGDSPSHTTNNMSCVYNSQTGHIDLYIQSEGRVYHQERDIQWINANQFYVLIEAGTEYEEILGPFNRV